MKLEHFNGIAEIEVEDLVRIQNMHFGEGSRFQKIINGRSGGPSSARQFERRSGGVGAAIEAALDGVGMEVQQRLNLVCGHATDVTSAKAVK